MLQECNPNLRSLKKRILMMRILMRRDFILGVEEALAKGPERSYQRRETI